jgi:hypothetical protein
MVQLNFVLVLALIFASSASHADVLFEGYSKVLSGDQHIGYTISRYEFDVKKKQFISTYFMKVGKGAAEVTESLKARATEDLAPISYEYTSLVGKETKTIDAKFSKDSMKALVLRNGKTEKIDRKIPKGTFLSTFLVYLMLKSKSGLQADSHYEYQAIAEEDGSIEKGQALVGKEVDFNGFKSFKTKNTFKDSDFLSYLNERGEVLGTQALGQSIQTELVAIPEDATKGQSYSATILKTLFGSVPEGVDNVQSRALKLKQRAVEAPSKQQGVEPGQGIIIKTQPTPAPEKKGP